MNRPRRGRLAVGLFLLPWLLSFPLVLAALSSSSADFRLSASFVHALGRSLGLALAVSSVSVSLGLGFAWTCRALRGGLWPVAISCLLLPALAGQLAIGFLAKVALFESSTVQWFVGDRRSLSTLGFVAALCLFQYAPLSAFALWLRAGSLPKHLLDYSRSARLTPGELASDVFWPHCRSLCRVMFVLVFLLTATEFSATDLSIRPSNGTSTALLSHWLAEQYRIWVPAGYKLAVGELVVYGFFGAGCIILAGMAGMAAAIRVTDFVAERSRARGRRPAAMVLAEPRPGPLALNVGAIFTAVCILPFVVSYSLFPPRVFSEAVELLWALLWSIPTAGLAAGFAATVAGLLRVSTRGGSVLGLKESSFYLLILSPLAMPPLLLSTAAFVWFGGASPMPGPAAWFAWLVGQMLVALPLLAAFASWLHSRITDQELDYQQLVGASTVELIRTTFLDRLRLDYTFLALFAWSVVWNDGVVNRGAAAEIPSLYAVISPRLSVRPDYQAAQLCLMLSVVAAMTMIAVWQRATARIVRTS